jgi:hypothetical protein
MLTFLVSIPIIALAPWLVARTVLRMLRLKASWTWWAALSVTVLLGGYAGYRLGDYDLQTSPTFRWVGLPLPIAFFVLEGDHWTDLIPPEPVQWMNSLADTLSPILLLVIPLAVIWRRRESGANTCLQATPGSALGEDQARIPGAPEAHR